MKLLSIDVALGVIVAATWGLGIVFAKLAIQELPPLLMMGLRSILTALLLLPFAQRLPRSSWTIVFMVALTSGTLQFALTLTGLQSIDASLAALLIQMEVPFLFILSILILGDKASFWQLTGLLIATLGLLLIAGQPMQESSWVSIVLVLGGALAWAVGQILARSVAEINGMSLAGWVAAFAAPQLLGLSLVFETNQADAIQSASLLTWLSVVYLALIMGGLGYAIWYALLKRHSPNQVAPVILLVPLFSVLGGVIIFGERLSFETLLGGCVILVGVSVLLLHQPHPKRAAD
jgi:O-acetylserine/cysteine efflux transporter